MSLLYEQNTSNCIIEEYETDEDEKENIKHSQIVYNIDISKKDCNTCNYDSFTLISTNQNMFNKFLNTKHVFQKAIFNFLKKIAEIN